MKRRIVRFFSLLGCIILLISLGLNYYLLNLSTEYYRELNATRLDPLGLSSYASDPTPEQASDRIRVLFFGDSRAASWPAPLDLERFEFINRGIGAQTSAQVLQRFRHHVTPLRPQVIILQVGINDLKTLPLFPEQQKTIIENCKANIREIVALSKDLGAIVILTTIFPVGDVPLERRPVWSDEIAQAVNEVNTYLHSLAADTVMIFDAYALLADGAGVMRPEYAVDTLHVSPAGYDALNSALSTLLISLQS